MGNYFITRTKLGRKKFFIIISTLSLLQIILQVGLASMAGTLSSMNLIIFPIGFLQNIVLLLLIELLSNWTDNLIHKYFENGFIEDPDGRILENLKNRIWSSYVYLFVVVGWVAFIVLWTTMYALGMTDVVTWIVSSVFMGITSLLYCEILFLVFMPAYLIFKLPKEVQFNLNVFHPDQAGGSTFIANYLLKVSILLTLVGSGILFWATTTPNLIFGLGYLVSAIIPPILYFILPTIGLRSTMVKAKDVSSLKLSTLIENYYMELSAKGIDSMNAKNVDITNVISLIEEVKRMRTWPFSVQGLRNLSTTFLLPVGIYLFNNQQLLRNLLLLRL